MPEPQGLERYQRTEQGLPVIGLDAWARGVESLEPARAQRGAEGAALVRHEVEILTRAIDTAAKTITIVAGTSGVDRYRDRIMVAGYDDTQFRRNPIMPWCHEYWSLPVAQGINPRIEGDAYVLEASFADTSRIYPFASMVWEMYAAKVLRMASVGGMPATWVMDEARRGMDVTAFDLWEVSLCPLGVNPDAMAKAKLNGIDARPLDEWARAVADAGGSVVLSKARAEAIIKALGYGKGLVALQVEAAAVQKARNEVLPPLAAEEAALSGHAYVEPSYDVWDLIIENAEKSWAEQKEEARAAQAAEEATLAEKPKPRQKDKHPDEDEMPMEEPPADMPPEEMPEEEPEEEVVSLDLEEAEPAADEEEIELDEAELQAAVEAAVLARLAEAMKSTPAGEAR